MRHPYLLWVLLSAAVAAQTSSTFPAQPYLGSAGGTSVEVSRSCKGQSLFPWLHLFFSVYMEKLLIVSSKKYLYNLIQLNQD